jgi:hypothetical protein
VQLLSFSSPHPRHFSPPRWGDTLTLGEISMSQPTTTLDVQRIAEAIDVILTEIYGRYVAKGSPTKLGGLRFLDVESAKTFAFETSRPTEKGNLLVISAPFMNNKESVEGSLKAGPQAERLRELVVRKSPDAGKSNRYFVEAAYFLETPEWVTDERVLKIIKEFGCNGNDAVARILKQEVLPIAAEIMEYFIKIVRMETEMPKVVNPISPY